MSFSHKFKTLRSGNSYDSRTQPEMLAHGDENTGEEETRTIEGSEKNSMRFSPELEDEKIEASLEPLHAKITALTEMMDRLIQSNSAKEATAATSRGIPHRYESSDSRVPGSSRFLTVAPLTTAGYSPDKHNFGISLEKRILLHSGSFFCGNQNFQKRKTDTLEGKNYRG